MQLYLIRHAEAAPLAEASGLTTDADRPLTAQGQAQADALAKTIKCLGLPLTHIVTSPLLRAQQTAERLRDQLQTPRIEVQSSSILAPGGSTKRLAKFLRKLAATHVALVGHEPDLGRHTAWLIGSKRARIELAKGGMACLACDQPPAKGAASLVWLLTQACMAS
jgi:phosphohistidine phosphatase